MIMAMIMGKQHESDAFTVYQRCWGFWSFSGLAGHMRTLWAPPAGCPAGGSLERDVSPSLVERDFGGIGEKSEVQRLG